MPFGELLDSSLNSMEEERFKKKHLRLIRRLSKTLHFNQTEVECLLLIYYKIQKRANDNIGVKKAELRAVLQCGFDMTDDNLMPRIYYVIDKGPSQYITMEIWAKMLSVFLRGTLEEQIDFCFQAYDLMGDRMIGRESILQLLRTSVVNQNADDDEDDEESVKDLIEIVTKKLDKDRDMKISYKDYKETVHEQPMMLEAFGQCLPSRQAVHAFKTTFLRKNCKI